LRDVTTVSQAAQCKLQWYFGYHFGSSSKIPIVTETDFMFRQTSFTLSAVRVVLSVAAVITATTAFQPGNYHQSPWNSAYPTVDGKHFLPKNKNQLYGSKREGGGGELDMVVGVSDLPSILANKRGTSPESQSVIEQTIDLLEDFRSQEVEKSSNNDEGAVSGLVWRGVVAVLCALWASNFAASKLIMGEPGMCQTSTESCLFLCTELNSCFLFMYARLYRSRLDAVCRLSLLRRGIVSHAVCAFLGSALGNRNGDHS
jgi:hypothetical protein